VGYAQIDTRYVGDPVTGDPGNILYPLRPAATYTAPHWGAYHSLVSAEIDAFEERFTKTLRRLSSLEAPEGLVLLMFDKNAPEPGTHGIPAAPVGATETAWAWSVFATDRVVLLCHDQRGEAIGPVAQTLPLVAAETFVFEDSGVFAGVAAADRTIVFPVGHTQAQVVADINAHATIGPLVTASADGNQYLHLSAASPDGCYQLSSDRPPAADSTGLGTIRQGEQRPADTAAHEIGHALGLHHASTSPGGAPDPSEQHDHHDEEWLYCIMSYVTCDHFCGKCVAKLRGWDETKVAFNL
jgi:hypothetical protein